MRELVVLGTASQVPTRTRNHNGYFLRWEEEGFLFDPGEGTQRQMTFAGVSAPDITRIFVTHFHGDHCFGLPGVLARLALDGVDHPVTCHYPASGRETFARLCWVRPDYAQSLLPEAPPRASAASSPRSPSAASLPRASATASRHTAIG